MNFNFSETCSKTLLILNVITFVNFFSEDLEYRAINGYKLAILTFHAEVKEISIDKHLRVCQLLSGIFNEKP